MYSGENTIDNKKINFFLPEDCNNYLLDDPILDWLDRYGEKNNLFPEKKKNKEFNNFLKKKYTEFFDFIISSLEKKIKITNINQNYIDINKKINISLKKINIGSEIIINSCLYNNLNNICGYPSIIIRSDIFLDLFPHLEDLNYNFRKGCKFNNNWHYLIIDLSLSTLQFSSKKKYEICNSCKNFMLLKSKLYLLNQSLGNLQNYESNYVFVIGRKTNDHKLNSFQKIGFINLNKNKKIILKTEKSLKWLKRIENEGDKWDINNNKELIPNMCNKNNNGWYTIKKDLAIKNGEITLLWGCGIKERDKAFKNKIYSWNDLNFNPDILGLTNYKKQILKNIISINNFENELLIRPRKIKNYDNIKLIESHNIEYYVDFETINNLNDKFNSNINNSMIFMIGCIAKIKIDNKTIIEFQEFTVDHLNKSEELKILKKWINFMEILEYKYKCNKKPNIYHWSNAEKNQYKNAKKNHKYTELSNLNFVDILEIFTSEPIVLKNTYEYGLKEISKKMYEYKMINTIWDDQDIDGREAMLYAWTSESIVKNNNSIQNNKLIKDIKKYNYFDCKVLEEIIDYIRKKLL